MTKPEERMAEIKASVEESVKAYNEAKLDRKMDEVEKLDKEMTDLVNEYTSLARKLVFDECAAAEDPMLEAVKRLSYETIGVRDVREDGGDEKREIVDRVKQIDLLKLHKYVKDGIGKNKDWPYMIEKLNMLMTADVCKDLGIDPKAVNDSYAMSDIARSYNLGKNPASKTQLLKTLTMIVAAMIGEEYKPVSHDVNYLLRVYTKKGRKALTVVCANHRYMRGYVGEICHRIVTGARYDSDYKKQA